MYIYNNIAVFLYMQVIIMPDNRPLLQKKPAAGSFNPLCIINCQSTYKLRQNLDILPADCFPNLDLLTIIASLIAFVNNFFIIFFENSL